MKILLDECLPHDLRHCFSSHEVHTVGWAGLTSTKNGELLRRAEECGYVVLLTVDQGIPYQQRLIGRRISILAIRARSNRLPYLLPIVRRNSSCNRDDWARRVGAGGLG